MKDEVEDEEVDVEDDSEEVQFCLVNSEFFIPLYREGEIGTL